MQIQTRDLWESAFIMCEGGEIDGIRKDFSRGRREVVFIISGTGLEDHLRDYKSGRAICNVVKFRACMNHLKDLLFSSLER